MPLAVNEVYRRNLAALSQRQPALATSVDAFTIPAEIEPAIGRDGSATFAIRDNGRVTWFGQTSMPSISAPAIFADFRSTGVNVALPRVLSGYEPLVIIARLPRHAALFVLEPDLLQIKLALLLHEYAPHIEKGRLVFAPSNDLGDALCGIFEAHPGYELPRKLLTVPQLGDAEVSALQGRLEHAGSAVLETQGRIVDASTRAIGQAHRGALPECPRTAVLSVDARAASIEQAHRIARGLRHLGWPYEICVPDVPDKCHIAARLKAIQDVRADLVLLVNASAGPLRDMVAEDLPMATWYVRGSAVSPSVGEEVGARHVMFAASQPIADALVAAGVDVSMIEPCAIAADDTIFHPVEPVAEDAERFGCDVAILGDLPDDRPEANDVSLHSHVALWDSLRKVARNESDRCLDHDVERLLALAERASGVTLKEQDHRRRLLGQVRDRIVPVARAAADVKALRSRGYRVAVWGANWPNDIRGGGDDPQRGPIPDLPTLNRLYLTVPVLVLPGSSLTAVQFALDAMAAGVAVIYRRSGIEFAQEYPGLAALAPLLHEYDAARELPGVVEQIADVASQRRERAADARAVVLGGHTVMHRLHAMASSLRARRRQGLHGT